MKKSVKIICVCLACCVIIFGCASPRAMAIAGVDDLVIVGGTVMTLALVSALGMMSMNSAGMASALQQAATNAQQNVKAFSQTLFESYVRSQNITAGQAVKIAAQGTSYLQDGKIIFDDQMSSLMDGFINWAWGSDGGNLIEYGTLIPEGDISIDYSGVDLTPLYEPDFDYTIYPYTSGSFVYNGMTYILNAQNCYIYTYDLGGVQYVVPVSDNANGVFTVRRILSNGTEQLFTYSTNSSLQHNGFTYYYNGSTGTSWPWSAITSTSFIPSIVPNINGRNFDVAYLIYNGVPISSGGEYDVNLDVLNNVGAGEVGVFDPDNVISIPDAPVGGGTINIDDWLEAIADAIADGTASIPITLSDAIVTDAAIELTAEDAIPVDITAEQEGAMDVQDASSIEGLNEYTLDLVDFFPFCIPFDIYDMLSMFAAGREAPHFDYRFYIPGICDEMITIDLSPFDPVALVLRRVELVAFAIGLAFVTKKLIQGGD